MTIKTSAAFGLVLCAVLAAPTLPAAAQVHRWVDEQGRVHYGDRPLGATGTTLRIRAEAATAPGGSSRAVAAAAAPVATVRPASSPARPEREQQGTRHSRRR